MTAANDEHRSVFIIPFFNEAQRMVSADYQQIFIQVTKVDFVLVDDGSTDKTFEMLENLALEFGHVSTIRLAANSGKAEAIRHAVLSIKLQYDYIGYLDADLSTPVSEMLKILKFAKDHPQQKIVMGSRIKLLGNQVERSAIRHYGGRIFATLVSKLILKIPVYDTQCGAKVFRKDIAPLFEKPFLTRWLFDVELLLRLQDQSADLEEVVREFPLMVWRDKGNTKIRLSEFLNFPLQMIKIYFAYGK